MPSDRLNRRQHAKRRTLFVTQNLQILDVSQGLEVDPKSRHG